MSKPVLQSDVISCIIYIRGRKVILDYHLARLYEVETRVLNQAVKRNIDRFPLDFMFELTDKENKILMSQNVISSWGGRRKLPLVFTEQGVAMLSGILRSKKAVIVNVAIMRAFVKLRELMTEHEEINAKIEKLESKYDKKFLVVFEAIKQLVQKKDEPRKSIGFKIHDKE